MISVGIVIGTTTTQLVFSTLHVAEVGPSGLPLARHAPIRKPRAGIVKKEVIYQSPIYLTPYAGEKRVDAEALKFLMDQEYQKAGFTPQQVETGAILITGEAAKTSNAQELLEMLAPLAGDFVVTMAGPSLEAHLAGRGSGAATWSARHYGGATNVDIGGGTTNVAIFRQGDLMDTAAIAVGGRHIEIDHATGRVRKITRIGARILDHLGSNLSVGDRVDLSVLRPFAHQMARLIVELLEGALSPLGQELLLTPPLRQPVKETTIFISGGVADCFYENYPVETLEDVTLYDDVGPLLAAALRSHLSPREWNILRPPQTIRATVMGASLETLVLSGMTIWIEPERLPMRNIPVVRARLEKEALEPTKVVEAIRDGFARWNLNPARHQAAIALDVKAVKSYEDLLRVAEGISMFVHQHLPPHLAVILVMEHDLGKALGQVVKARLPQHGLLSIDEVWLDEGDYIDIGRSMLGDRVVSLVVKTLIFSN
jgi:ethanolamine utilization protein EutA